MALCEPPHTCLYVSHHTRAKCVTPLFSIDGTARVILRSRRCTKGFFNYFSAIIKFLKVVFKREIVKFSKNYGTFSIKESGGAKVQIMEFQKDNNNNKLLEYFREA